MIDEHETHPLKRWQLPGLDDPKVDESDIDTNPVTRKELDIALTKFKGQSTWTYGERTEGELAEPGHPLMVTDIGSCFQPMAPSARTSMAK